MTKHEVMKRQVEYNKKRTQKLGLANMMIYKEDRELIRELAKTKGKTNADACVDVIVGIDNPLVVLTKSNIALAFGVIVPIPTFLVPP